MTAVETAHFLRDCHMAGNVPDYENVLAFSYRQFLRPGMNIVDIGAHKGRHTRQFLEIIGPEGRVWAFEPLPHLAASIELEFRDTGNLQVIAKALSDSERETIYKFVENYPEESGLKERRYNASGATVVDIPMSVSTLDAFFAGTSEKVDFVKIDVEGGEIDVLAGGQNFLKRNRPILSIEYGKPSYEPYGNTASTLFNSAKAMGYVISDLFGNTIDNKKLWKHVCDTAY